MFLDFIEGEDKIIFIEVAKRIAEADGIIHINEETFLEHFAERLNLDSLDSSKYRDVSISELMDKIKDEKSKRAIFVEAIALAFADEVYHEEQKDIIKDIREGFNFSSEYYHQVKNWIIDLNNIYKKGLELISS